MKLDSDFAFSDRQILKSLRVIAARQTLLQILAHPLTDAAKHMRAADKITDAT